MAKRRDWRVHPNRFADGPDEPGQNGHFRSVIPATDCPISKCFATVVLPDSLADLADLDGTVTFGGKDWWFALCTGRMFARSYFNPDVPPPFGYKDRGRWYWWDGTTSDESILEGPDEAAYVAEYFALLFPGLPIEFKDNR